MICVEISLNGKLLWRAGIVNATIIAPILGSFVGSDDLADLHLSAMCDLPGERSAHVYWGEPEVLRAGDRVRFTLVDTDCPTLPSRIEATDSPEYLEEQRQFEELDSTFVPPDAPIVRRWHALAYGCSVNGEHRVTAVLAKEKEHMLCSLLWDRWSPERCRIYVRSFGGPAVQREKPETEWLRANLLPGDFFETQVMNTSAMPVSP